MRSRKEHESADFLKTKQLTSRSRIPDIRKFYLASKETHHLLHEPKAFTTAV